MNYLHFAEQFKSLKPSPVYLFSGEERLFIDEGVKIVTERFLSKEFRDFNYDLYFAGDIAASKVIEIAETLPVMAECRVLIVKGINEWGIRERDIVASYTDNPSPYTCLVMTAIKLDKREKFFKAIEKNGIAILCNPLYRPQLINWVKQQVNRTGKTIDNDGLNLLVDFTGSDMLALRNDLEKLILYCGDRKDITVKDVILVSASVRSVSVFEVVSAIIDRRFKDAVRCLKRAIDDGEPPLRIFYFIVKELRTLLKARILLDSGKSLDEAAKAVDIPPFRMKDFSQRLGKFSRKELSVLFEKLRDADGMLKGGVLKPEIVIEDLVLSMNMNRDS